MESVKAASGHEISKEMFAQWIEALDKDEWPEGEYNVGEPVMGRPPLSAEGSTVLSVKVPPAMKRAIENGAKSEGMSTSDFVRLLLASSLMNQSI